MTKREPDNNFVDFIEAITLRTDNRMEPCHMRMMHEHLSSGGELAIIYPLRDPRAPMPLFPGVTYVCSQDRARFYRARAAELGLEFVERPRLHPHRNGAAVMFEVNPAQRKDKPNGR